MQWIDAKALDTWAGTQIGRAEISRLVGRLIWATAGAPNSFRFPAGEAAQIPGFDGHLIAPVDFVHPFVPAGESVWEFGADKSYFQKAQSEYAKRTRDPGLINPPQCTFVFVTPRIWASPDPTLLDWEKQKQGDGTWRNVLAIDAVRLEHWLDQHEAVAKDLAREIKGLAQVAGVRSVREFWEEYAERFNPKLIEQVVLSARRSEADDLIRQLTSGVPQAIKLQADSRDEVVAFAAAAIRTAEPDIREFLEARTLVLDTKDAVTQRTAFEGMIFLPRDAAVDQAGSLSYRAPTVVPLARVDVSSRPLSRPSWTELYEALKPMLSDDERAERLARESGRSVTILARRIPRVERPRPPWSSSPGLLAALMAGAWDDALAGDKKVLATLSGRDYDDFEIEMRPLLSFPEPLEREGSVWKVRAPVDTFVELGSQISGRDVERLRSVVKTVFSEIDPSLDMPVDERRFSRLRGKTMQHSDWLRDGLATTLVQIAVLHQEARFQVTGITPQSFVDDLMASLPGLGQDPRLLMSLGRQLPWLMEAAPRPLLAALEHLLEGDGKLITPIFEEGDPLFSTAHHTHILWALEMLAWNPAFLNRVALDLAKLARLDPGGRLTNRPIKSLTTIFKPWIPQTKAPLSHRLSAIDLIIAEESHVGWKLILSLLPSHHDFSDYNPRPRLRESTIEPEEKLTYGIVYQTFGEIVTRAIRLAHGKPDRVLALLKSMNAFRLEEMERVCDEVESLLGVDSNDERLSLWSELRDTVSMHAAHEGAQWVFPATIVSRLRSLQQRLAPTDPILKVQWLFDKHFPELDHAAGEQRVTAVEEARSLAIRELRTETGDAGIAELARRVKFPGLVGRSAGDLLEDAADFDHMLTTAYSVADMPAPFPMALSSVAHERFGTEWSSTIVGRAREGLPPEQLATLLLGWSDERTAWDLADTFGPEVVQSYWTRRMAYPVKGDLDDQKRAAVEYLKIGHAIAAMQSLWDTTKELPAELVFEILDRAIVQIAAMDAAIGGNLAFEIGEIFGNLAARPDISQADLARREYAYLPLLKYRSGTPTLHRMMAKEATFFVSILCDVFRSASGEEETPTAERKGRAQQGYELLSSMTLVPGFLDDGNQEELFRWVSEVRRLAAENDRAEIADQFIGQVLAHCPADPTDDAWPHLFVRKLIEELKSDDVERGIQVGRSNMAGAHPVNPKFPATLEHDLAAKARDWATTTLKWHRTTALLNSMAEHWEFLASALEQRGRQDAMRD